MVHLGMCGVFSANSTGGPPHYAEDSGGDTCSDGDSGGDSSFGDAGDPSSAADLAWLAANPAPETPTAEEGAPAPAEGGGAWIAFKLS